MNGVTDIRDISIDNGNLMHPHSTLDPEEFRRQAHLFVDFIADYYRQVNQYPVLSQVAPGYLRTRLPDSAPDHPEPLDAILHDVRAHIIPGLTHWQSPNYYAYFPSTSSTAGFLGEMLSVGFNVNGFLWHTSPAATELENIVMDWVAKILALPKSFHFSGGGGGVLHGTTGEAILCTLVAARDKALGATGRDRICDLVVYSSDQTHCSLKKAAQIAGVTPDRIRALPTRRSDAFALRSDVLRAAVAADVAAGLIPLYLCCTVGTTSTTAVDPLRALCAAAEEHGIWVHVDAAYAGSACICPEFRHFIDGVEGADSFSFNAHKWFFTPLDCCCLWLKEPRHLVNALSVNAEYLRNEAAESKRLVDYKDWQMALSHRFRAIKLWMVLRSHGVANLRNFIRSHVSMALLFEGFVEGDERFEVVVPRNFALVCFRLLLPEADLEEVNAANKRLLSAVNATGKVFMSHAVVDGIYFIRFVVAASLTEKKHVRAAWQVVREQAEALLAELKPQATAATAATAVKELAERNLHGAAVVVQEQA